MEGGYGDHRGDEEVTRSILSGIGQLLAFIGVALAVSAILFAAARQPSNKEQAWQNLLRAEEIYQEASK